MAKKTNSFLKLNTIKTYIKKTKQMRSGKEAVENLIEAIDKIVLEMLITASRSAKNEKRNTILQDDIENAVESHLKNKNLTWEEISALIIKQNPANIGKISNKINTYIVSKEKK